jgi:ATP-dependent Clp protease ATP-binding subunit ClpX
MAAKKGTDSSTPRRYRCSMCGKSIEQIKRLIAGPSGVHICNECIVRCYDIIADDEELEDAEFGARRC